MQSSFAATAVSTLVSFAAAMLVIFTLKLLRLFASLQETT